MHATSNNVDDNYRAISLVRKQDGYVIARRNFSESRPRISHSAHCSALFACREVGERGFIIIITAVFLSKRALADIDCLLVYHR